MPARIRKIRHDDETRAKIQAGNIINRLTKAINGKVEMSGPQVTAALGLLKKVLPDLTSVEHSGEISTPYVAMMPPVIEDSAEWAKHYAPKMIQ